MKDTKKILLETAADMFAKYGFMGVSTRALAKESGVNLCSINYYFGSKRRLYEAVIEDIVDFILNNFVSKMHYETDEISCPREEIKVIFCRLFDFLCGEKISEVKVELLLREFINPSSAYSTFYKLVFEPLHQRISDLISSDCNLSKDDSIVLAHALIGQIVMFKIHKKALLLRLEEEEYTSDLLLNIKKQLQHNIDAVLDNVKGS